jgi:hypothetical protein
MHPLLTALDEARVACEETLNAFDQSARDASAATDNLAEATR